MTKMYRAKIDGMIYPQFFKGSHGKDDLPWILSRMKFIPESKQLEVAEEYEKLFSSKRGGDRDKANTYLNKRAKFFYEKRANFIRENIS